MGEFKGKLKIEVNNGRVQEINVTGGLPIVIANYAAAIYDYADNVLDYDEAFLFLGGILYGLAHHYEDGGEPGIGDKLRKLSNKCLAMARKKCTEEGE